MSIDRTYIRRALDRLTEAETNVPEQEAFSAITVESVRCGMSSQQAEHILCDSSAGSRRKVIRFLFAHKETLKRIPGLGKVLVRQKEKMLFHSLKRQIDHTIDLADCISWYRDDFIVECYRRLLGRTPDSEGFCTYANLSRLGADNRVLAYAVIRSDEFAGRARVQHTKEYRKAYHKFMRKQTVKRVPVLGRVVSLLAMPHQIERLYERVERSELVMSAQAGKLERMAGALQASVSEMQVQLQTGYRVQQELGEVREALFDMRTHLQSTYRTQQEIENVQKAISEIQVQLRAARDIQKALETQAAVSAAISEKIDGQTAVSKAIFEKLDGQAEIFAAISKKIDGQAKISTSISEKLDGQTAISTASAEKLDGQAKISTIISEKLDELPAFISAINVSSHTAVTGVPGGVIAVVVDGFIMGVPAEEWGFAMFLSQVGHFEPGSERFYESLLKPGMRVLDLGANLGIYTLRALRAGCTVFSYEPTPRTCALLKQNIKASGFAESCRTHVMQMAVSDQCGTVDFYENSSMCGHNSMYGEAGQQAITVQTVTLDSQLDLLEKVDVIKMDIEGAEYYALCGMKELLRKNPGVQIIMEFAPVHLKRSGVEPMALLNLVHEFGFSVYQINEATGEVETVPDEELLQADSVNVYLKREG